MCGLEFLKSFAFVILFFFIFSCTKKDIKQYALELNQHQIAAEESFQYFEYKQLIEDFPFENSSSSEFYREFIKEKYRKLSDNNFRSLPKWESIGPFNIAGRTLCLAINPKDTNQLWMGSAGSGLWKSNSAGIGKDAWHYISTGFPVSSVSSVAIQENNPAIIYIGTGEIYNYNGADGGIYNRTLRGSRGIGILKSMDGGNSWKLSLDWTLNNQTAVWKIIVDPIHAEIIYAATNIGIYKTIDSGKNWNCILDYPLCMDLLIDHKEPEILYAGVGGINGKYYGVYKTIDAGMHWQQVKTPNDTLYQGRIMLANYKANPKRVYATFSDQFKTLALFRSRNGFDSTNFYLPIKDVSEHQGWYAKCMYVKDDDSSNILIGGVDMYLDSTGTGNQLFNLLYLKVKIHADLHDIISNPFDPNKIYIATDGGLFRSDNFGRSFYACNQGYLSSQFYTGSISKHSGLILGGLQDNKSAMLMPGSDWKNIHQADGTYNATDPENDSILYISSQYQNLYVSFNQGANWKELIAENTNASFVSPFLLDPNNSSKIYSGGNVLLISNSRGISWDTSLLTGKGESIVAMKLNAKHSNQIYISSINANTGESHLYFSNNSGYQLQLKEYGIPERFIRDIAIDPINDSTVYLALGGSGQAGIMNSEDAGNNWLFTENRNLPDVPYHCILIDPKDNNILYAGCDFGLYASFDRGKNWFSYNTHPYDLLAVYDVKYSVVDDQLILFTHGFGTFRCSLLTAPVITNVTNYSAETDLIKAKLIYNYKEDYIYITGSKQQYNKIILVNLEGKEFGLQKNGESFSTRALSSGIYYVKTSDRNLKGIKIPIIH